jgi:nucleoside phosphorylase
VLGVVTGLRSEAKLLSGTDLACVSTGGRAHIARAKIDRLIGRGVRGLISFGIAGALSPDLRTGDLVIADTVTNDIGEVWRAHEPWTQALGAAIASARRHHRDDAPHHAAARRSEGHATPGPSWSGREDLVEEPPPPLPVSSITSAVRPGRQTPAARGVWVGGIIGLDRMLSSPRDKAQAFAQRGALCVDMESHHVARMCAERALPFIAVRAISDQANETLPAVMAGFVDQEGQTKMSAVLAALIFGRVGLGQLLRTGRASRRAHQALLRCRGALAGLG